jgi:preprotein translocase subunit SecD
VRGFAVVLLMGIATSVFTSVMGSHAVVQMIYGGKRKLDRLSI